MKEWICEEVPALTVDGKVIDTMLLMEKELVRCRDCKHYMTIHCTCDGCCISDDWFCADGKNKGEET